MFSFPHYLKEIILILTSAKVVSNSEELWRYPPLDWDQLKCNGFFIVQCFILPLGFQEIGNICFRVRTYRQTKQETEPQT